MKILYLNLLLVLIFQLAFFSCGKNYSNKFSAPRELKQEITKIAVLPFNDLTGAEGPALIVSKMFASRLQKIYKVKVVEGEELLRQLSMLRANIDETVSRLSAARVAQALEVDAVVYGNILEYRYRNWVNRKKRISGDPVVCISARLVNGETGTVVWAGTDVKTEYSIFPGGRDPLSGMAERVVSDLIDSMKLNKK